MNLEAIKEIVNSGIPVDYKEKQIIQILAKDSKIIPLILEILEEERSTIKEVMQDMNLLLSQADTIIELPILDKDKFFRDKIRKFYLSNQDIKGVFHCFKDKKGNYYNENN